MTLPSGPSSRIRVLIADDSAVMRAALSRAIESAPALEVCGVARYGLEALEKVRELRPDVITLDVEMPGLNGIEVLKRIMKEFPRPVIMVSSLTQEGADTTLEALGLGAFDYLSKGTSGQLVNPQKLRLELIEKIAAAAESPLARQVQFSARPGFEFATPDLNVDRQTPAEIIALGTSTGGPKALQELLPQLPADLPAPVLVVQHMPPGFTAPFAKRLNSLCKVRVSEAQNGDLLEPGSVFIAPAGVHTTVSRQSRSRAMIHLSESPSNTVHKPSVDVTMLSVAEEFGSSAAGIIMTGMGSDGLQGITAIHKAGGITIGQDEATSAVYGMPRCCAENRVLHQIVPLHRLSRQILHVLRYHDRQ